jgi:hypothetical protein
LEKKEIKIYEWKDKRLVCKSKENQEDEEKFLLFSGNEKDILYGNFYLTET